MNFQVSKMNTYALLVALCLLGVLYSGFFQILQMQIFETVFITSKVIKIIALVVLVVPCAYIFYRLLRSQASIKLHYSKFYLALIIFAFIRLFVKYDTTPSIALAAWAYSFSLCPLILLYLEFYDNGFSITKSIFKYFVFLFLLFFGVNAVLVHYEYLNNIYVFDFRILSTLRQLDLLKIDNIGVVIRHSVFFKSPVEMGITSVVVAVGSLILALKLSGKKSAIFSVIWMVCCFLALTTAVRTVLLMLLFSSGYVLIKMSAQKSKKALLVLAPSIYSLVMSYFSSLQCKEYWLTIFNPTNLFNRLVLWAKYLGINTDYSNFLLANSTVDSEALRKVSLLSNFSAVEFIFGKGNVQNGNIDAARAVAFDNTYMATLSLAGFIGLFFLLMFMLSFFRSKGRGSSELRQAVIIGLAASFFTENLLNLLYLPFLLVIVYESALDYIQGRAAQG